MAKSAINWHVKPHWVKYLGVELEGRWSESLYRNEAFRSEVRSRGFTLKGDGSVRAVSGYWSGECVSSPVAAKNLHELQQSCQALYPQETDSTCGLHVHMSFHGQARALLCTERFEAYLLHHLALWGKERGISEKSPFWTRLAGQNQYCRKFSYNGGSGEPSSYVRKPHNADRYHVVNWTSAGDNHGTCEIRVLPGFQKKEIAIEAIRAVYCITEEYLQTERHEIAPLQADIDEPSDEVEVHERFGVNLDISEEQVFVSDPESVEVTGYDYLLDVESPYATAKVIELIGGQQCVISQ